MSLWIGSWGQSTTNPIIIRVVVVSSNGPGRDYEGDPSNPHPFFSGIVTLTSASVHLPFRQRQRQRQLIPFSDFDLRLRFVMVVLLGLELCCLGFLLLVGSLGLSCLNLVYFSKRNNHLQQNKRRS